MESEKGQTLLAMNETVTPYGGRHAPAKVKTAWTDDRLNRLFERYNRRFWGNRLRKVKVRIAHLDGCCGLYRKATIFVDVKKHPTDQEIRSTLLHEMCHDRRAILSACSLPLEASSHEKASRALPYATLTPAERLSDIHGHAHGQESLPTQRSSRPAKRRGPIEAHAGRNLPYPVPSRGWRRNRDPCPKVRRRPQHH